METYLTRITDYLLAQSWQIVVLVVVIAAVNSALRNKSAHVRYLLWLIVLAKCLAPPLLTVPLAVLPQEIPAMVFEATGTTISEPLELPSDPVKLTPAPMVMEKPVPITGCGENERRFHLNYEAILKTCSLPMASGISRTSGRLMA